MSSLLRVIEKNKELFNGIALRFLKERRQQISKELLEVEEKIREFEGEHGAFEEYADNLPDSFNAHEVWFTRKTLIETKKELERELADIEEATRKLLKIKT
jgi:RNA polymerase-binding transcription factor DksA